MNHKLTGNDVMTYKHEKKLTKTDVKCMLLGGVILLLIVLKPFIY